MKKVRRRGRFNVFLVCLMCIFAVVFGGALGALCAATVNVMNTENFTEFESALPTRVLDINGELICEFAGEERRELISFQRLPRSLIDALLTREDRAFYEHHGFNVKSVLRAAAGIVSGASLGGGSTLTQQIAGTLYADRREYSLRRKIRELWWAIQMERRYSKDEILELYLNRIYFGGGTYGVAAASRYYFGHDAENLTPAEAALLVIQLSNPSYYNPFEHPSRAMSRQRDVLNEMVSLGYVTQGEADASFDRYWTSFDYTRTSATRTSLEDDRAPWFSEYVRRELSDMLYGNQDIYSSGFTVYTTVNLAHQAAAEQTLRTYIDAANAIYRRTMSTHERRAFARYVPFADLLACVFNLDGLKLNRERARRQAVARWRDVINPLVDIASLVFGMDGLKTDVVNRGNALRAQHGERTTIEGTMIALNSTTGYIDALVGGREYSDENQFIRATQALLQPGSTFKPLYYSEAIDSRMFSMTTVISDTPVVFHNEDGSLYIPQDFRGVWEGDVELWYALAHSMNVPSLKVLDAIGFDRAIARVASLLNLPASALPERHIERVYPLGLGVCSVRPVELAAAYATIANRGRAVTPIAILRVEDRYGNVVANPEADRVEAERAGRVEQKLPEATAFIMQEIMKNTVQSGTLAYGSGWDSTYWVTGERRGRGSKFRFTAPNGTTFTMPAAGKTGTTQNWADAWAAGFTPYYTSVFWFGFDQRGQSLGLSITGSTIAGVAWGDFMNAVHQGLPYKPFFQEPPEGLIQLDVCTESGGLLTPECGDNKISAWYYPGTEPTAPCALHTDNTRETLGILRLQRADIAGGYRFLGSSSAAPLSVDLSFLDDEGRGPQSLSGASPGTDGGGTVEDFSNWLLD